MNELQKAIINMQRAAGQHLGANIPIIKTVCTFRTAFHSFKGFNAQIIPAVGGQKTSRLGFAGNNCAPKKLCDATLTIAKPMRTFAADIGDNSLRDEIDYVFTKLNHLCNNQTAPYRLENLQFAFIRQVLTILSLRLRREIRRDYISKCGVS